MIGDLANNISEVNNMINGLVVSNEGILDSVEKLSSVTEEVTANSEEAASMCDSNLSKSDEVKGIIGNLLAHAEEFDKYL